MSDQKILCKYDELVEADNLKEHPFNPNTHPDSQIGKLADYIRDTGWRHPVIVSKLSGYIIAGHGRKQAGELAGVEIPVVYQDFKDEAEERAFLLADNRLAELAELDTELVDVNLDFLSGLDFDLESIGFDSVDDFTPDVVTGKETLDGQNYTNTQSSRYSINFFGVGGFVPREKGDVIKTRLESLGAVCGQDNSEILERFIDEILSLQ